MKLKQLSLAAFAALAMAFSANAQGESSEESLKFSAGDRNLEVQLAPLGGNPISINGIRYRSFMSSTSAYRVNAFVGYTSSSTITQQAVDSVDQKQLKDVNSSFTINLRPGYEIHFAGTKRLSPYIGGEFDFGYTRTAFKSELQNADDEIKYVRTVNGQVGGSGPSSQGMLTLGLNGVAGFDYYFAKSLYVGAEFGFGFSYQSMLAAKQTSDQDSDNFTEPDPVKQGGSFNLGPNVNGQFRLGFLF